MRLSGIIVAVHTPVTERGEVHEEALREHVEFLIESGVHGLFPLGTMGEGIYLSDDQREEAARIVIEQAKGRVDVIVQATSNSTANTIRLVKAARDDGADAVSVIAPYFYPIDELGLEKHYTMLAKAVPGFPVYLYNNPGRSASGLSSSLVGRLTEKVDNIVGIKDSSKDLILFQEYIEIGGPNFTAVIGTDGLVFPSMMLGGTGVVSAVANPFPELMVALYKAICEKDYDKARQLQVLVNKLRVVLKIGPYLAAYKEILKLRGRNFPTAMIAPLRELTSEEKIKVISAFDKLPPVVFTGNL